MDTSEIRAAIAADPARAQELLDSLQLGWDEHRYWADYIRNIRQSLAARGEHG